MHCTKEFTVSLRETCRTIVMFATMRCNLFEGQLNSNHGPWPGTSDSPAPLEMER